MSDPQVRGRRLLALGAVAGIGLAAFGLARSGPAPASLEGAVAVVNGQPLSRDAFERFVAAVAAERKTAALPLEERQRILERLVDEELLLQHGLSLGLARHEPTARRVIVQSVIASVTAAAEARDPEEDELREYHARNPDRFVRPGRVVVETLAVPIGEDGDAQARTRASRAGEGLAGGASAAELARTLPGVAVPPLPGGPLPVETVRRYLGPTAALKAGELPVGEVSEPFRTAAGYVVLRVAERDPARVPPIEEVADLVRAEWLRTRGEEALVRFLADLREVADVEIASLDGSDGKDGR